MEEYIRILKEQERLHAPILKKKHDLICKQLDFGGDGCPPLYMAKKHWTNRFDQKRDSTIGIFCSIWVAPSLLKKKIFAYNIHAISLQKLPGYQIIPKSFASDYRKRVRSQVSDWPGISLKYGPRTLLQGKETCELESFADKVEERILGFTEIYQPIDELLENSLV